MTRTNKRTLKDLHEAPPSVGPKATHKGQANPDMNEQKAMTLIVQKNRFPGETAPPLPDIFVPLDGGVVSTGAPTAPGIPGLNSAIPGPTTVDLSWSVPGNGGSAITGFNVYRGTSPGGEVLLTSLGVTTTFNDTGLTNGTTYYYRVSALNAIGESIPSNELAATPAAAATVPGAPTLTAATPGDTVMDLTWTAPGSNGGSAITGYKVYRGTASGAEALLTTLGVVLSFHDTGLSDGTTYFYKVSAINAIGEGALSNELSATPVAPGGPTLLDDFNRANAGNLGANWTRPAVSTSSSFPNIVGNAAIPSSADGTEGSVYWNGSTYPADTTVTGVYTSTGTPASGRYHMLLMACSAVGASPFTGYVCSIEWSGTITFAVYRCNAGAFTAVLGRSSAFTPANGDVFSVTKSGGAFTIKRNGSTILTFTDPAPLTSAGYVGLGGNTSVAGWDSISVG